VGDFRNPALVEVFDGVHIYNELDPILHAEITSWIASQNTILPDTIQSFNEQSRNGYILCDDRLTVGTVSPGYDDTKLRENGTIIPRNGNETYQRYWANIQGSELDWVIITSWNEWHEATEIEPSIENGYDALRETRNQLKKFMRD
ncbi:MAG: glycoside hydrolase family 99-like domain-containing protein, partial [Candidatus Bathyarchaeota archaeon]|nr:glycoside hydrolase family 99-like domain-containing protein [Candidatus Bathyarchaeota archaeon]